MRGRSTTGTIRRKPGGLLAEAGYAKGFKTTLTASSGYGRDLIDAVQMVLRDLKEVGIDAELKMQEYGAYQATTGQGKFEGMAMGPYGVGWEPDSALYRTLYAGPSRATAAMSTTPSWRPWSRSNGGRRTARHASNSSSRFSAMRRSSSTTSTWLP